jgi:DNA polymerase-3 subunit delta'
VVHYKRLILVDAIRDLERHANFRPYEATARFFIVDEAEKMNEQASNALLKTLEEPSPTTYIFLITSRPDSLLPTIRSRCQMLRFAPIETERIEKYLIEERAFSHDEARLASRLARGSIGRAVSINVREFREQRERMLTALTAAIMTRDRASMLLISEQLNDAKNKDKFEENLSILESLIHDVWTLRATHDADRVANTDVAGPLRGLAERSACRDLTRWFAQIAKLRTDLVVNINRRVATDALFVSMSD